MVTGRGVPGGRLQLALAVGSRRQRMFFDQPAAYGAADYAAGYQAEGGAGDAELGRPL